MPKPISGYTKPTDEQIAAVNDNKQVEELVLRLAERVRTSPECDGRWASVAITHFQEGFMALNRAIMKPTRVDLDFVELRNIASELLGEDHDLPALFRG